MDRAEAKAREKADPPASRKDDNEKAVTNAKANANAKAKANANAGILRCAQNDDLFREAVAAELNGST